MIFFNVKLEPKYHSVLDGIQFSKELIIWKLRMNHKGAPLQKKIKHLHSEELHAGEFSDFALISLFFA